MAALKAAHLMSYNLAVPKKPNPAPRQLKVGDKIRVSMHGGKIVDAAIKAILDTADGTVGQFCFPLRGTVIVL
jgi:hypothetical protein